jgi:hypothetical protein
MKLTGEEAHERVKIIRTSKNWREAQRRALFESKRPATYQALIAWCQRRGFEPSKIIGAAR